MTAVAEEVLPKLHQNPKISAGRWAGMWPTPVKKRHRVRDLSDVKKSHVGGRSSPTSVGELRPPTCAGLRDTWDGALPGAL